MAISWSPIEDTFLIENAHRMSYEELSLYLDKTENAIQERSILLGCTKSTAGSKKVAKVCSYAECQRIFWVRKSDFFKKNQVFCSDQCSDLYDALFYPTKEEIEQCINAGKSFEEISNKYKMPVGALYGCYLRYGIAGRPNNIEKVLLFNQQKNKIEKRNTILNQTGRSPMAKFRGGYKPYLGVSVRSGWENNVLLWLNHQGIKWDYEPKVFYFNEVKRGTKGYTPDIWLKKEKIWIEVKGYLSSVDKTKTKRFKKYYPDQFKNLHVITKNDKVDSTKFFQDIGVPVYAFYDDINEEFNHLPNWIH